jgi:cardiolipin synthase
VPRSDRILTAYFPNLLGNKVIFRLPDRIFGLPPRARRIGIQIMRLMKSIVLFFAIAFTLAAQSQTDSSFCSLSADRSIAVKTKATVVTKIKGDIGHVTGYLGAEHWMKRKIPYETWDQISARFTKDIINNTAFPPRNHGQPSLIKEDRYRNEMAALLSKPFGFQWSPGNQVDVLLNGRASFTKRKELIDNAQESIYIFSWAFYDDGTGWDFADWLINAKLKRLCAGGDLEIKIVVDGNVAKPVGYHDVLRYLEKYPAFTKRPIEIIRLHDTRDPYFGMHRKLMIVDREHMVMGGMNVGNKYSHLYPDPGGHWRDTDVYVRGPVVNQAQMTFVDEWNEQKGRPEMTYRPFTYQTPAGESLSMIVDHQPLRDDNIHVITVKAFYGATQTIDIENAYVIADTVLEKAIIDALKRSVRVRILSNSKESIDEPTMTTPILQSLARLKRQGAEVYTKKVYGDSTTLHSKLLIVDGVFSWIGSHNFHPRSYRYEREVVLASFDERLARQFTEIFEKDIAADKANHPTLDELTGSKSTWLNRFITTHFFDQL